MTKHLYQKKITLEDLFKGEIAFLTQFLNYIICGPDARRGKSEAKQRRIQSIANDIIFAATEGRYKSSKHIKLGMTLKSLTGSKKVVQLLNRMGHCVNYDTVEELETEVTFTAAENLSMLPNGVQNDPTLVIGKQLFLIFFRYDCELDLCLLV